MTASPGRQRRDVRLKTCIVKWPEIKSAGGRRDQNVKEVKVSVEGADVNIKKLVLHWENADDKEVTDLGMLKARGKLASHRGSGPKGSALVGVSGAETAVLKIWGHD